MAKPNFKSRLSATDAVFLYAEREDSPLHIGSIAILEEEVAYEDLVQDILARVPKIPRFLQRAVPTPFNAGHPTWEYDQDFDIHEHIHLHQVTEPGGEAELTEVLERIYTGLLDRKKPLWEIHLVIGLEGGKCAIAMKVHHAMVDGVGGQELLAQLVDFGPGPPQTPSEPLEIPKNPRLRNRLVDALFDNTITYIDAWSDYFKSTVDSIRNLDGDGARARIGAMSELVPDIAKPVQRLPFNIDGSGERRIVWFETSFAEARAMRRSLGGSVNDVVLTIVAGGISRYCKFHGESVENRTMRIMMPVNTRPKEAGADLGNRISILPVRIPLGIEDPAKRILAINKTTATLKGASVSSGMGTFGSLLTANLPVPAFAQINKLLSAMPIPLCNMLVTNVPGPQIPLYMVGKKIESLIPYAPVAYDMGLGCAVMTYNQKLTFALTVDRQSCEDVEKLREFFQESFEEVRKVAGVAKIEEVIIPERKKRKRARKEAALKPEKVEAEEPTKTETEASAKATAS